MTGRAGPVFYASPPARPIGPALDLFRAGSSHVPAQVTTSRVLGSPNAIRHCDQPIHSHKPQLRRRWAEGAFAVAGHLGLLESTVWVVSDMNVGAVPSSPKSDVLRRPAAARSQCRRIGHHRITCGRSPDEICASVSEDLGTARSIFRPRCLNTYRVLSRSGAADARLWLPTC